MQSQPPTLARNSQRAKFTDLWLRKHADYQRVYRQGKRQSLLLMTVFFAARHLDSSHLQQEREGLVAREAFPDAVPLPSRVGLTAGRVVGNAVERNRIKRRMRTAVRLHYAELAAGIDVILHPRRSVLDAEFSQIEREVLRAFRVLQTAPSIGRREGQPPHVG